MAGTKMWGLQNKFNFFSTLAQLLARQESFLGEGEIMRMFEQILSAVSYLHDNNVLHRYLILVLLREIFVVTIFQCTSSSSTLEQ